MEVLESGEYVIQRRGMERGRKSTVMGWMVSPNHSWAKIVESGGSTEYQRMSRRSQARVKIAAVADHFVEVSRLEEEAKQLREANARLLETCERDMASALRAQRRKYEKQAGAFKLASEEKIEKLNVRNSIQDAKLDRLMRRLDATEEKLAASSNTLSSTSSTGRWCRTDGHRRTSGLDVVG